MKQIYVVRLTQNKRNSAKSETRIVRASSKVGAIQFAKTLTFLGSCNAAAWIADPEHDLGCQRTPWFKA